MSINSTEGNYKELRCIIPPVICQKTNPIIDIELWSNNIYPTSFYVFICFRKSGKEERICEVGRDKGNYDT